MSKNKKRAWTREVVRLLNDQKVGGRTDWTADSLAETRGDEPEDAYNIGLSAQGYVEDLVDEYLAFGPEGE